MLPECCQRLGEGRLEQRIRRKKALIATVCSRYRVTYAATDVLTCYSIASIIIYELKTFYSYLIIPRECQRSPLPLALFVRNQENPNGPLRLYAGLGRQLFSRCVTTVGCYGRIKEERLTDKKACWVLPSAEKSVPYSLIFLRAHLHVLRGKHWSAISCSFHAEPF